jgi:RNA polymerase sigma-70 factor (ECF subfamily)
MPKPMDTDGELLRRAAAGESDAFSVLYARYEAIVAGFLVRRSRDRDLAADLTAETFAAAIVGASSFRDEGQAAVGWLLGIARHLLARSHERGRTEDRARRRIGLEPVSFTDATLERVEAPDRRRGPGQSSPPRARRTARWPTRGDPGTRAR